MTPDSPISGKPPAPLRRALYQSTADVVAPQLLGHWLLRRTEQGLCGGIIVETEAYIENDPSCHAYKGISNRNRVMWGEPGHAYVYLIYGFYYCFNAVCRPTGTAEAVLVRAIDPQRGVDTMLANRPVPQLRQLGSGPGKLCRAMAIDRTHDGVNLCDPESPLWIGRNPQAKAYCQAHGPVVVGPRIGITQAADWPLRFHLQGSEHVSRRLPKPRPAAPM